MLSHARSQIQHHKGDAMARRRHATEKDIMDVLSDTDGIPRPISASEIDWCIGVMYGAPYESRPGVPYYCTQVHLRSVLDRMVKERSLVALTGARWRTYGLTWRRQRADIRYYTTALRHADICRRAVADKKKQRLERARDAARRLLARRHRAEFEELVEDILRGQGQ